MVELILFSIIVGIFVKGWLGKLLIFPIIIALYTTLKFFFSAKARIIRENKKYEGYSSGVGNYIYIFVYKTLICVVVSGITGLIVKAFR